MSDVVTKDDLAHTDGINVAKGYFSDVDMKELYKLTPA